MQNRYIAFDVETPNHNNDRMSAIGVTVVENGAIVDELYSLVDPGVEFDSFNISLTGITPELVRDAPAFPELWESIAPVMSGGLLLAHSAPFDMGVLAKCLSAYHIDWQPYAYYACTCVMGRECYPELPNHKLNTLCSYLDISLDHHNAGSDSRACAELLLNYMRRDLEPDRFIRRYDFASGRSRKLPTAPGRSYSSEQLLKLRELLGSVTADDRLSKIEVYALQSWMDQNTFLRGSFPFDKVFGTVSAALSDGVLESSELAEMLALFEQLSGPADATDQACGSATAEIH